MSFDGPSIVASFFIGLVGFSLFVFGKKERRPPQLVAGVLLMVFPYFTPGAPLMVGIALAIVAALVGVVKHGW